MPDHVICYCAERGDNYHQPGAPGCIQTKRQMASPDLSKYREELAEVLRDAMYRNPAVGKRGDNRPYSEKVADALLASPVVARMLAEAKAEALREVRHALVDMKGDGWWKPGVTAVDVLLRGLIEMNRAEASGREGER